MFGFLRSLKVVLMKTVHSPMPFDFCLVFMMETIHVIGVAVLFYGALPYMDSVRAVMSARYLDCTSFFINIGIFKLDKIYI